MGPHHSQPVVEQNDQTLVHPQRIQLLKHMSKHKGLQNGFGQNNCFLNVILQTLWHLDSFRVLITSNEHRHKTKDGQYGCLICSLQTLFCNYEYGAQNVLDADNVRITMELIGAKHARFQVGEMDDATEALDAILQYIHGDHMRKKVESFHSEQNIADMVCEPRCISHQLFGCDMFDLYKCEQCGATSDPVLWKDSLYRIYVSEVVLNAKKSEMNHQACAELSAAIKQIANLAPSIACPENGSCKGRAFADRWILQMPIVFGISLVWATNETTRDQLQHILYLISNQDGQRLDLTKMFSTGDETCKPLYCFRGMVCYYGKHYVSFFYSMQTCKWFLFDDQTVRNVGTWQQLCDTILSGLYQPTLLFWEQDELKLDDLKNLAKNITNVWNRNTSRSVDISSILAKDSSVRSMAKISATSVNETSSKNESDLEPVKECESSSEPPIPRMEATTSDQEKAKNAAWACPICTLENSVSNILCQACGNKRQDIFSF